MHSDSALGSGCLAETPHSTEQLTTACASSHNEGPGLLGVRVSLFLDLGEFAGPVKAARPRAMVGGQGSRPGGQTMNPAPCALQQARRPAVVPAQEGALPLSMELLVLSDTGTRQRSPGGKAGSTSLGRRGNAVTRLTTVTKTELGASWVSPVLQPGPRGPILEEQEAHRRPSGQTRTHGQARPPSCWAPQREEPTVPCRGPLSAHTSPQCRLFTPPTVLTNRYFTNALRSDWLAGRQGFTTVSRPAWAASCEGGTVTGVPDGGGT